MNQQIALLMNGVATSTLFTSTLQNWMIIGLLLMLTVAILYIIYLKGQVKREALALENQHIETSSLNETIYLMTQKIESDIFMFDERTREHYKYVDDRFVPTHIKMEKLEELIHPDDIEQYKLDYSQVINGTIKECISYIRIYNKEKNRYEDLKNVIRPIKVKNGKVTRYVYIQQNETETRALIREQEALIESLHMALKSAQIFRWGRYEESNKMVVTDCDMKESTLTLEESAQLFPTLEEFKRFELFTQQLSEKEVQKIILQTKVPGEEGYKLYEINGLAIKNKEGKTIATYGVSRDISESVEYQTKLTEKIKLLETIEESMPVGISIYDREGNLQSNNEEVSRLFGIDYDRYHNKKTTLFDRANPLHPAISSLRAGERINFKFTYKDIYKHINQWVNPALPHGDFFEIRCTPIVDEEREILGYLSISIDMTQDEKNRELLRQAKEKAETADRLKTAFLANISHEIRTPLNAIIGFSGLLQTAENAEEHAQYMEIINTNNDHLLRLINDILELSKIESGLLNLVNEEFDLSSALEELYETLQQSNEHQSVELLLHNPYKRCIVNLDRERCLQILTIYLNNALKFTHQGHIRMGYEYRKEGLVLFIEDSGIGIPEEKTDKLFQHFSKLDEFGQGAGLGLPICKAITEAMGGKVGVRSTEGEGSIFWVWIPCEAIIEE